MLEAEYWQKVVEYASAQGHNKTLLERFRQGFNFINKITIDKALQELSGAMPVEEAELLVKNDATANEMIVNMRNLIGLKRAQSNLLFDNQHNQIKCAEIVQKILNYEAEIEEIRKTIKYYNENGEMPKPEEPKSGYVYPTTKFQISKDLASARCMISQVKEELEKLAIAGEKTKMKKREQRLVDLNIRKEELEKRLKEALI